MKRVFNSILIACIVIFIIACKKKESKEEKFTISGNVSGFPDGTTFYLRNLTTDVVFDSTTVKNNSFRFEGHLANPPEQIWLNTRVDKKFIYTNLLIGNEDIHVKADIADFPKNVSITGSKTQEDFDYLQNIAKKNDVKRDSLLQVHRKLSPEKQKESKSEIRKKIRKIDSSNKALKLDYIKSHPNSYASVIELGYRKHKLPKDTVQKIFNKYTAKIKESKYAKPIEIYLKENISKIGDQFQDFEGLNQKEEKVKFSDIRGEYTLLDFTRAYCGPCVQAAGELVEISKKHGDSLKIVSVSQDVNKEIWLKSLERDKVTWNSIWDGQGWNSETSIKYGAIAAPTFVLINPEGKIIDNWKGYRKGGIINRLEKNKL